jgi:hypothetical protein
VKHSPFAKDFGSRFEPDGCPSTVLRWEPPSQIGVPIEDEKSRSRLIGESFPQVLNDPTTGGMSCDRRNAGYAADYDG